MYETKEERHEVYKAALKRLEQEIENELPNWVDGLCHQIHDVIDYELKYRVIKSTFVEFASFKPVNCLTPYWWKKDEEGNQARVEVLKKCIKMTAP